MWSKNSRNKFVSLSEDAYKLLLRTDTFILVGAKNRKFLFSKLSILKL